MKTKKLIESAYICAANVDFEGCSRCAYNGEHSCSEVLISDLANRLEKLHEKSKAKKVDDAERFADLLIGFCPNCGDVVGSTTKYCQNCGRKLKWKD